MINYSGLVGRLEKMNVGVMDESWCLFL